MSFSVMTKLLQGARYSDCIDSCSDNVTTVGLNDFLMFLVSIHADLTPEQRERLIKN